MTANSNTQGRNGTLTIAGQAHSVTQQGRAPTVCSYALSPTTATYNKDAADGTFAVTAPADCSWTATSNASWVTFTAGDRGAGNGSVSYRVARNLDTTDRTAAISVADQTFTVRQAGDTGGCQYSVAPVDVNLCMAGGNCDDDGDDAAELQLDGVSRRVVAQRVERIIGHRNWRGYRDRSQQLRRPAHRDDSGALADSDVGSERPDRAGRLPVCREQDRDRLRGGRRFRHLRRHPAKRPDRVRRRDTGPVCMVGTCRCPVDHDHERHAAIGRQPGRRSRLSRMPARTLASAPSPFATRSC